MTTYKTLCDYCKEPTEVDEDIIRKWFMRVDLEQARDTFRVVEGIIETRETLGEGRRRRKDAGVSRPKPAEATEPQTLPLPLKAADD